MDEHLSAELVHLTCPNCKKVTSFSYSTLAHQVHTTCGYCGHEIPVDIEAAKQDARRKAHELDESVDSLGSVE